MPHPAADPGPFHIRDYASWAAGWDLDTQLPALAAAARTAGPPPARGLPPLPDKWGERRPGDHDWSGPGGTCADCPAPNFLDAAGPCTWGA